MRRTKIVATIGPSSSAPETIAALLEAGMDVARLNFSNGSHEQHAEIIATLRRVARHAGRPLALLQDLQGPKIRTGLLAGGEPVLLETGARFIITTQAEQPGSAAGVGTTYAALPRDVRRGDHILLSDGLIELLVRETSEHDVTTEVVSGGLLHEKQGINLPGVAVSAPSLTAKDAADLAFGLEQGVDYVALSFVRSADDIADIKQRIAAAGKDVPVVAKIEKPEALDHLDDILRLTDVLMVARGDLGVEIPTEQVPPAQKHIIRRANNAAVPVITATQMLDSMIRNPRPTRAEASDVANAIIDGTDAVMLSGETATGAYPVEAVRTMARIVEAAEHCDHACQSEHDRTIAPQPDIPNAISEAACAIVAALPVKAVVAFTMGGNTARLVANQRPHVPILAFTPSEAVYHRLNLLWGVTPVIGEFTDSLGQLTMRVHDTLLARGIARTGDMVVMIGGHPLSSRGITNFLKVVQINPSGPSNELMSLGG